MSDFNTCCICLDNNNEDLQEETERLQYTCTHAPCMCSECRKDSATCNPICPICRANITILPPLPPVKLQNKYRQLCENYSYVPRQRELQILGRIEEMVEQHNDIYMSITHTFLLHCMLYGYQRRMLMISRYRFTKTMNVCWFRTMEHTIIGVMKQPIHSTFGHIRWLTFTRHFQSGEAYLPMFWTFERSIFNYKFTHFL